MNEYLVLSILLWSGRLLCTGMFIFWVIASWSLAGDVWNGHDRIGAFGVMLLQLAWIVVFGLLAAGLWVVKVPA